MGTSQSTIDVGHEDSNEIRRDIRSTRSRMDETLDELGERLSPHHLLDDVLDLFRGPGGRRTASKAGESAAEFGANLGRTVRDNPVPSLLIGAGLAWLAFGRRDDELCDADRQRLLRDRRYRMSEYEADEFYSDDDSWEAASGMPQRSPLVLPESYGTADDRDGTSGLVSKASSLAHGASETMSHAKQSVAGAASKAGETLSGAAGAVKGAGQATASAVSTVASGIAGVGHAATDTAERAYRGSRRAGRGAYRFGARSSHTAAQQLGRSREQFGELCGMASDRYREASREYPLAVGMGCLALGMIAGLVIPRTRREDEWMGEQSDELIDQAWHTGEALVERGEEMVSEVMASASESAEQHGLSGENLLERGARVVSKVATAAAEAAKEEGLDPSTLTEDVKAVGKEAGEKLKEGAGKATESVKQKAGQLDSDLVKVADKPSSNAASDDASCGCSPTPASTTKPMPK